MADLDKFWYQVFFQVFLEFFSTLGNFGTFRVEISFFTPKGKMNLQVTLECCFNSIYISHMNFKCF